jgi:microcystin degradation protein MlrC
MRIAIGQLWQETNTFNPIPTTRHDFEQFGVLRGATLLEQMAGSNELGGFTDALRGWPEHPEIVGLVRLPAWPGGMVTPDTRAWLRQEVVDAICRAPPLDGILLALHGALVAEDSSDVEGDVLKAVRRELAPGTPVVATLDLHANVTERMVREADALVLYQTIPHLDVYETGKRGAAVLRRILVKGARPVTAFQKIPMVVPAERANTEDPGSVSHRFKLRLQELEKRPQVLSAGLATVQPWLDIPELGTAALVVTDGDRQLAVTECSRLAANVWDCRTEYLPELVTVDRAVREAHANVEGLVVLSDSGDATTSGAPGDSTWVLRELLKYDWPRPALVALVAPEIVTESEGWPPGVEMTVTLGGVRDRRFSQPLRVAVRLERLFDARFVMSGHLARNMSIDMGRSAVLRHGNVHILVTSRSGPHFAPELFQAAGIDPFGASVLVAKSPCGFRAAYERQARNITVVQAPGCAPSDFWRYDYRRIPRPLWPWDDVKMWTPQPQVYDRLD